MEDRGANWPCETGTGGAEEGRGLVSFLSANINCCFWWDRATAEVFVVFFLLHPKEAIHFSFNYVCYAHQSITCVLAPVRMKCIEQLKCCLMWVLLFQFSIVGERRHLCN